MKNLLAHLMAPCFFSVPFASAATIVDTGPGSSVAGGGVSVFSDIGLNTTGWFQNVAAQITVDRDFSISSVQGWMAHSNWVDGGGTTMRIDLYDNAQSLPTNKLFSGEAHPSYSTSSPEWYGVSGLSWSLPAGTYWLVFSTGIRLNLTFPQGASNPLAVYGFENEDSNGWVSRPEWSLGIRVEGDLAPVPLPAAAWMLGSSLVGLTCLRRRNKGGSA